MPPREPCFKPHPYNTGIFHVFPIPGFPFLAHSLVFPILVKPLVLTLSHNDAFSLLSCNTNCCTHLLTAALARNYLHWSRHPRYQLPHPIRGNTRLSALSAYPLQSPLTVFQDPAVFWFFPSCLCFLPPSFLSERHTQDPVPMEVPPCSRPPGHWPTLLWVSPVQ